MARDSQMSAIHDFALLAISPHLNANFDLYLDEAIHAIGHACRDIKSDWEPYFEDNPLAELGRVNSTPSMYGYH